MNVITLVYQHILFTILGCKKSLIYSCIHSTDSIECLLVVDSILGIADTTVNNNNKKDEVYALVEITFYLGMMDNKQLNRQHMIQREKT